MKNPPPIHVSVGGQQYRFAAGPAASLGSDPRADVVVAEAYVTPLHAALAVEDGAWVLRDQSGERALFHEGQAVDLVVIRTSARVFLGAPGRGAPVDLAVDGYGLRTVATGPSLRITVADFDRVIPSGKEITIGRSPGSTVAIDPNERLVSGDHLHLQVEGGQWVMTDVSRRGTFVGGRAISTQPVLERVVVRLGHPTDGALLTLAPVGPHVPDMPGGGRTIDGKDPRSPADRVANVAPAPEAAAAIAAPVPSDPPPVPGAARSGAAARPDAVLRVLTGGRTYELRPGAQSTIGRDPSCDIVLENPLVSRRHAGVQQDARGWIVRDLSDNRGLHINGKAAREIRLSGQVAVWFGPEDAGEKVVFSTDGPSPRRRRLPVGGVAAVTAVVIALLVAAIVVVIVAGRDGADGPNLEVLTRSTVRVVDEANGGRGTGTLISSDGLILTNAHVAAPASAGQAVLYGAPVFETNPEELLIEIAADSSSAVEAAYRAVPVAVDGYLDFAVLQIVSDSDGNPIDELDLPFVGLADSQTVAVGDSLWVLGFPGVSETDSINISDGKVTSIGPDERIPGDGSWLNTDANMNRGNSGGLAADSQGRLLGVPTQIVAGDLGIEYLGKIRPVHLALPLIEAAREDRAYVPSLLANPTGSETFNFDAWVESGVSDCGTPGSDNVSAPSNDTAYARFVYSNLTPGQDLYVGLLQVDGEEVVAGPFPVARIRWDASADGCTILEVEPPGPGLFVTQARIGPDYLTVLDDSMGLIQAT